MYLPPFRYFAPQTLDEAIALLREHGDEAKLLAGGQSLLPLMMLGLARPGVLIDVNGIPGLDRIEAGGDDVRVGALVRHCAVETDPRLRARCPALADAAPLIGNIRVRHRGTVGGSLAHADPAAEVPLVATALGATIEVRGPDGARDIPAHEFFRGYLETALGPAEVVTALRLPAHGARMGHGLAELVRRSGDFAMVSACAVLGLDGAGRCTHAAVAMGGVGPSALRMRAAERLLVGQPPGDRALDEAADAVRDEVAPESDVHASAEYRRAMARVMARRALRAAAARAGGASPDAGPGAVRS